jgi:hypothetical protein
MHGMEHIQMHLSFTFYPAGSAAAVAYCVSLISRINCSVIRAMYRAMERNLSVLNRYRGERPLGNSGSRSLLFLTADLQLLLEGHFSQIVVRTLLPNCCQDTSPKLLSGHFSKIVVRTLLQNCSQDTSPKL